ncbi:MAG TPA: DUF5134 domain-containing protein, partial [Mycobacterium sp.]|nr:DUF5134 domain-containing protein [Mycobacterium sp.]
MSGFVIDHLMLRCIVTVLLVISIAGYVYALVAQHGRSAYTVKHALHLAMSAAMIAMAWSVEMTVPTVAPIIFFLLAAVWFVLVPARISCGSGRLIDGYHAAEMTAMAWMYAVMDGGLESQTHAPPGSPGIQMAGMEVPGPEMSGRWIGTVNWAVAAGFAVATL